jgi:hypothetical protein
MQQLWLLPGAARSSWRLPGLQHATPLRGLFIHLSGCHQRHTGRGVACSCSYPQPELSSCVAHAFRGIMRPRFWHMQAMSFAAPQLEKAAPAVLWHGYLVPWEEEQPGKQTSSPPATRFGELTGAHLTDLGDTQQRTQVGSPALQLSPQPRIPALLRHTCHLSCFCLLGAGTAWSNRLESNPCGIYGHGIARTPPHCCDRPRSTRPCLCPGAVGRPLPSPHSDPRGDS